MVDAILALPASFALEPAKLSEKPFIVRQLNAVGVGHRNEGKIQLRLALLALLVSNPVFRNSATGHSAAKSIPGNIQHTIGLQDFGYLARNHFGSNGGSHARTRSMMALPSDLWPMATVKAIGLAAGRIHRRLDTGLSVTPVTHSSFDGASLQRLRTKCRL